MLPTRENFLRLLIALCLFALLGACGMVTERSVYEGIRANTEAKSTGSVPAPNEAPPYDQYDKERRELKR